MQKKIGVFVLFVLMWIVSSVGYAAKDVAVEDISIPNMPGIELKKQISLNEVAKATYLGNLKTVKYDWNDTWAGAHAWFADGELWIEQVKDAAEKGPIVRVVINKQGFTTQRGISIGDTEQKVLEMYGQPDYTPKTSDTTAQSYKYCVNENGQKQLQRMVFHINESGQVDYIGYSQTGGGI